ncbi:MAG: hypothetical protein ACLQVM_30930, partial [Terriglobia bacterium]
AKSCFEFQGKGGSSQAAEKLVSAVVLSEALECGSLLPHSKAPLRMTAETSFSAACEAPPFPWNWTQN